MSELIVSVSGIRGIVGEGLTPQGALEFAAALATHANAEDLIRIGAYTKGASPQLDRAIELQPALRTLLRQSINERTSFAETRAAMDHIAAAWPF